jgi:hypothetical protein
MHLADLWVNKLNGRRNADSERRAEMFYNLIHTGTAINMKTKKEGILVIVRRNYIFY